jgi:hypothetical protein
MGYIPHRFVSEPIEVIFDKKPLLEKIPGCPEEFLWREEKFCIVEVISEWHDYRRKGRMARNMSIEHATVATRRGSWGVGQDYYRVLTENGRIFDIYYDRAPKDTSDRKGRWFLYRELLFQ